MGKRLTNGLVIKANRDVRVWHLCVSIRVIRQSMFSIHVWSPYMCTCIYVFISCFTSIYVFILSPSMFSFHVLRSSMVSVHVLRPSMFSIHVLRSSMFSIHVWSPYIFTCIYVFISCFTSIYVFILSPSMFSFHVLRSSMCLYSCFTSIYVFNLCFTSICVFNSCLRPSVFSIHVLRSSMVSFHVLCQSMCFYSCLRPSVFSIHVLHPSMFYIHVFRSSMFSFHVLRPSMFSIYVWSPSIFLRASMFSIDVFTCIYVFFTAAVTEWVRTWDTLTNDHVWSYGVRVVVSSIPDRGNIVGWVVHPPWWLVRFSLIWKCLSFQILNLFRTLSSWGSGKYRPSAPLIYEVASHVKQLPVRPLLLLELWVSWPAETATCRPRHNCMCVQLHVYTTFRTLSLYNGLTRRPASLSGSSNFHG